MGILAADNKRGLASVGSLTARGRLLFLTAGLRAGLRASLRADLRADLGADLTTGFS